MFEVDDRKWLASALFKLTLFVLSITLLPYSVGRYITVTKNAQCQALKEKTETEMFYSVRVDDCFSVIRDKVYDPQIFVRATEFKRESNVRTSSKTPSD